MELIRVDLKPNKEIYAIKANHKYYGLITGDQSVYVIPEGFDSPLKASNKARALKRELKIQSNIKKTQESKKFKDIGKISRKIRLYTEAEMASLTQLKFREAWIIVSPHKTYVQSTMENNSVVSYASNKESACIFKTYDEAQLHLRTLDLVIKKGHTLQRFFIEDKS